MADNRGESGRRWSRYLLVAWFVTLSSVGTVAADTPDPRQTVESVTENLRKTYIAQKLAIDADPRRLYYLVNTLLLPHADFDAMSAWVLGRYWNSASTEQREQFKQVFRRLLVRTYATAVQHIETAKIEYLPGRVAGKPDSAVVRTLVTPMDSPKVSIDYHFHRKEGRWLVYDLRIEGISLITNYRSSYGSQIQLEGLDSLIENIREKADALSAPSG